MPSAAFEKAESILMEKGVDLTKSDVKKIESLVDGFSEEEKENDIVMIFGAIESLRADPRSKLFDNGRAAEFTKTLQKNDLGITGGHQSGILIPKSNIELLNFLPRLDNGVKNPDAWIECLDEDDISWKLRYIHYNNKFHDEGGTRDEYRITHIMPFLRKMGAMTGDIFHIKRDSFVGPYIISIEEKEKAEPVGGVIKVKLSGWNKVC